MRRLRAMTPKLASDSGCPCTPAGSARNARARTIAASSASDGKGLAPAEMRGEQRHHRQAAGDRQRPAEKDEGDRARPLRSGAISATVAAACGV